MRGHRIMARMVFAILATLAFASGCSSTTRPPVPTVITEDDPRWDCETMGNRICGPTTTEVSR